VIAIDCDRTAFEGAAQRQLIEHYKGRLLPIQGTTPPPRSNSSSSRRRRRRRRRSLRMWKQEGSVRWRLLQRDSAWRTSMES